MGFDVVYLPPVHPIGHTFRKGQNNSTEAGPDAVGSPWAIGSEEGGHTAVHPDLGTLEDFDRLVDRAQELGMEVAMDLAYQCSPDHPWVREHPEWFRHRPDGTIQYAENPPKKYQDIYPLDFGSPSWKDLWAELKSVVDFWIGHGIRIFRVDNPHTKPFAFWEWLIGEVKAEHPDVIFLAEAFTRPKVMYELAKLGFTQSYTYFAWRNPKWELEQYFTELTLSPVREYFRPNLWPNTPDILTEFLQTGRRPAFMGRLVLAATLGASYGIYGPPFELCEDRALEPGSEEYLDSEKYQIRYWDLNAPHSLAEFISRVNRIRRENPALHQDRTLRFHRIDNDALIAYSKSSGPNAIVTVVNLDPHHRQGGSLDLELGELGIEHEREFQVHDLLTDARYVWSGAHHYVELDPNVVPAHVFRVRQRLRTERDFEYFA
jgi:starch synthase (maltosyl-transferring)